MPGPVLMDATPAAGAHGLRGVGAATRGLIAGMEEELAEAERPALLVRAGQDAPAAFAVSAVRWPHWPSYRVPDPAPRLVVGPAVRRLRPRLFHATQPAVVPEGVPLVVTCYDLIPAAFPRQYLAGAGRALEAREHGRWLAGLRRARLLMAISGETADDAVRLAGVHPRLVRVVPLAAPPAPPPAGRVPEEPYVLYAGGLEPHKNAPLLVSALAAAGPGGPRLVMAGPWSRARADRLARYAEAQGVGSRVDLVGFVDAPRLAALRAAARAVLVPSLKEGFGLPVLEGLAAGVPVLASDTPALREAGGEAARYLPPTDVAAWAAAIGEVTSDDAGRARAAVAGPAQAARFSWARTARMVADVYREALGG